MSWRSKDWKNPYRDMFGKGELTLKEDYETNQHYAYEAGADAMLEALLVRAKRIQDSPVLIQEHLTQVLTDGTWVFIPDEREDN